MLPPQYSVDNYYTQMAKCYQISVQITIVVKRANQQTKALVLDKISTSWACLKNGCLVASATKHPGKTAKKLFADDYFGSTQKPFAYTRQP